MSTKKNSPKPARPVTGALRFLKQIITAAESYAVEHDLDAKTVAAAEKTKAVAKREGQKAAKVIAAKARQTSDDIREALAERKAEKSAVAAETVAKKPVAKKAAVKSSSAKPAMKKAVPKKAAAAAKKPVAKKSTTIKTVAKSSSVKKPAA